MARQFIFVHIPKTGGNSVIEAYGHVGMKVWGHNWYQHGYMTFPRSYRYRILRHIPSPIRKLFVVSFCVVRNPWDRVLSAYTFLAEGGYGPMDQQDFEKYATPYGNFNDFVVNGLKHASESQTHFLPQTYWLATSSGKIAVDKVLRLDSINDDLDSFFSSYNIPVQPLGHKNRSSRPKYRAVYTEEAAKVVGEVYADEIALFGFQF